MGSADTSAPCNAMACAAYSTPHTARRWPSLRKGLSSDRWLREVNTMRFASHDSTSSSRHMAPRCGISEQISFLPRCMGLYSHAPVESRIYSVQVHPVSDRLSQPPPSGYADTR